MEVVGTASAAALQELWDLFQITDEPPRKRRRPDPDSTCKGTQQNAGPIDAVTLAHFSIRINVDDYDESVAAAQDEESLTSMSAIVSEVQCVHLDLQLLSLRKPGKYGTSTLIITSTSFTTILEDLQFTSQVQSGKRYQGVLRADTRLSFSNNGMSVRLEVKLSWQNGKLAGERIGDFADEVLLKYFPSDNMPFEEPSPWSPRRFYDIAFVPDKASPVPECLQSDLVQCTLYPFQKRTVNWLLNRENVRFETDGQLAIAEQNKKFPSHSFEPGTDAVGRPCFVSHLLRTVATDSSICFPGRPLDGGILAEEMGLGKTVEIISLICLHRMNSSPHGAAYQNGNTLSTGATLIITPAPILEQWMTELKTHAPSLKVFYYGGVKNHSDDAKSDLDNLLNSDVVVTTYNVLTRDIYYTNKEVHRDLRYKKRYHPRTSPLVTVNWWRVCLDEAQTVESGVSGAAIVARRIPCRFSWAVTGTPLRKGSKDLFGLLTFLGYEPFCQSAALWDRMITYYDSVFEEIFSQITLRHTKEKVRDELHLPPQRRIVITVPFTAIEEQYYDHIFERMCADCHLNRDGTTIHPWTNITTPEFIDDMRIWLNKLRQTCLHPDVGSRNYRVPGNTMPALRTVRQVLNVMVDANEAMLLSEQRALLNLMIKRGQVQENFKHPNVALTIWEKALEQIDPIVDIYKVQLAAEVDRQTSGYVNGETELEVPRNKQDLENIDKMRVFRQRLRGALEIQHKCTFFIGNANYQLKTNEEVSKPGSIEYEMYQKREEEAYEKAKEIRMEMMSEISSKVKKLMRSIEERKRNNSFTKLPRDLPSKTPKGIESRKFIDKLNDLCLAVHKQNDQLEEWRERMAALLLTPLVDEDTGKEGMGDEYENSTVVQDRSYVLMEALRGIVADRHEVLTGQANLLVKHDMSNTLRMAKRGSGPAPKLFIEVTSLRNSVKPARELGTFRGLLTELRSLQTSLQTFDSGNSRITVELAIIQNVVSEVQRMLTQHTQVHAGLEKELDQFRDAMNTRLEYYRQLQTISDTVRPLPEDEDSLMDRSPFRAQMSSLWSTERIHRENVKRCKAKARYLAHLEAEESTGNQDHMCIICRMQIEDGILTVCGHQFCRECMTRWMRYRRRRPCPMCKTMLSFADFHQVYYKEQEATAQEEENHIDSAGDGQKVSRTRIYSGISRNLLASINTIELPASYGTKINAIARHLIYIRRQDPESKCIVFSQYRAFLPVLEAAFVRLQIPVISVDTKGGIDRFRVDPSIECFLLHAKAHASGLNLINATHVFFCEPLINTALELQAIARVHRIGQHRPTTVWMYLVQNTVEESIYSISVEHRLQHISTTQNLDKGKGRIKEESETIDHSVSTSASASSSSSSRTATPGATALESALDAANSLQLQEAAPISDLLCKADSGGEFVPNGDVWKCMFAKKLAELEDENADIQKFLSGEMAEGDDEMEMDNENENENDVTMEG